MEHMQPVELAAHLRPDQWSRSQLAIWKSSIWGRFLKSARCSFQSPERTKFALDAKEARFFPLVLCCTPLEITRFGDAPRVQIWLRFQQTLLLIRSCKPLQKMKNQQGDGYAFLCSSSSLCLSFSFFCVVLRALREILDGTGWRLGTAKTLPKLAKLFFFFTWLRCDLEKTEKEESHENNEHRMLRLFTSTFFISATFCKYLYNNI